MTTAPAPRAKPIIDYSPLELWLVTGSTVLIALGAIRDPFLVLGVLIGVPILWFCASEQRIRWAIIAVALYTPFEYFLLKWLPGNLYFYGRFAHYGLLAVCLGFVLLRRVYEGRPIWPRTPVDVPVLAFACAATVSFLLGSVTFSQAAVAAQPLVRFIPLVFYAVIFARFSRDDTRLLVNLLLAAAAFEALIGFAQAALGAPFGRFLAPTGGQFGDTEVGAITQVIYDGPYQIFGTLARYQTMGAFMGIFLVMSVAMFWNRPDRRWILAGFLFLLGVCLILSSSRGPWLAALVGLLFLVTLRNKALGVGAVVVVACGLGLFYVAFRDAVSFVGREEASSLERVLEIFSREYLLIAVDKAGRLYYASAFLADVWSLDNLTFFFGFGPGSLGYTAMRIYDVYTLDALDVPRTWQHFVVDVNWGYLFGQYGVVGVACFAWIVWRIFRSAYRVYRYSDDEFERRFAWGFLGVMALVVTAAFFYAALEVRPISFYFWLFAGLVVKMDMRRREQDEILE